MAPIDITCPKCEAAAGRCCIRAEVVVYQSPPVEGQEGWASIPLDYHHAERVDAWARKIDADVQVLAAIIAGAHA